MTERMKAYATDFLKPPAEIEHEVLDDVADFGCLEIFGEKDLPPELYEADGVIGYHEIILSRATIEKMTRCRGIVRAGVGFDNVDCQAAGEMGIPVCHVPDYGTWEVADHAMALLLTIVRKVHTHHTGLKQGPHKWDYALGKPVPRLVGATLGIVGLGRIGTAVAMRAKAFGLKILFYDPYIPDGRDKSLEIERTFDLQDLMRRADYVSVNCPLNEETRHIVGATELDNAKAGAVLINTARGPCCDTNAVLAALRSGKLGGAGLDVLENEPPEGEPIYEAFLADEPGTENLVLTPHSAHYSHEAQIELRRKSALELRRLLVGESPRNCVNESFLRR